MKPWTPVTCRERQDGIDVNIWGRENRFGKSSFIESMRSQNIELLSAPMRIVGTEDGKDFVFGNYDTLLMQDHSERRAEILCAAESEEFVVNLSFGVEFDGFIDTTLTVMPRGRSVKQIFRLESLKPYEYRLERLWLEIPLRREVAKYCQFFPRIDNTTPLDAVKEIKEKIELPLKEQVLLASPDVGFMMSFESRESFCPFESEKHIEIIPDGDSVILRIRLLDEEPLDWRSIDYSDPKERTALTPKSFHFAFMTTPVKPMPKSLISERAVHIDCYAKVDEDYDVFLTSEFDGTGEVTLDRMKRLGVNTLYIHEKWNDLQNSPYLTTRTSARLKRIIEECHKRDIKVIPYFGYEISSLAPYYREMLPRVAVKQKRINRWYRYPAQRDSKVCQNSEWSEFFTNGLKKLLDEYGFDGVYLDGTAYVWQCENTLHGCGCYSPSGELHPTYPVFATRKTLRRIYEIVCEERGGIINCHAGSAFNMPALSFTTSLWDGEVFQSGFLKGTTTSLPDGYFECLYTGRNLGIPIYMLCYLNPPIWSIDMAIAMSLPFGILPKVNDSGEPLEKISEIWKIYESFGVDDAEWIPYYKDAEREVSVTDSRVKLSLYKKADKLLAIVATTDKELSLSFDIISEKKTVINTKSGEALATDGKAHLSLSGFDYMILELK